MKHEAAALCLLDEQGLDLKSPLWFLNQPHRSCLFPVSSVPASDHLGVLKSCRGNEDWDFW